MIKNFGINIPLALKDNGSRRERVATRRHDHFEKQAKADFAYHAKREKQCAIRRKLLCNTTTTKPS